MSFDKTLTDMKDYHIPVLLLLFFTGVVMQCCGKLDTNFVMFVGVILGALVGHSFSPAARQPDVMQPPVDVSVKM